MPDSKRAPEGSTDPLAAVITSERFTRLETELATRSRMQTAVAELGQASLTNVDASLLIAQACALAADTLGLECCRVLEYLPDQQRLVTRGGIGLQSREEVRGIDSEATFAFHANEPVVFADLSQETRFDGEPVLNKIGIVSGFSLPLPGSVQPLGTLGAYSTTRREFRTYEIEFAQSIANVLAAAIESKRTRQALAESRAEISHREKQSGIGSWSWSRGTHEWQCSDEIYNLLGLGDETIDYDLFLEHIAADDRHQFAALIDRASMRAGEHELEHRLVSSDGEIRVVRSVVESIFGSSQRPLRLLGTVQDITVSTLAAQEQTRLSALIELAAQEWRMTCDALDALVIVTDQYSTMLRVNDRARQLLRMTFDEAVGRALPSEALGEPWSTMRELALVVAQTGVMASVRANDSIRGKSWEISARALTTARKSDERVVIVAQDVTVQAERDQVRHDADLLDAVTTLIQSVSRRTNLSLQTLSELLASQLEKIDLSADDLRRARSATHDLKTVFRNLDEYARPFTLDAIPGELGPVLTNATREVAPLAARRNIRIALEIAPSAEMLINEPRLRLLFRDLLTLFVERSAEEQVLDVRVAPTPWRKDEWIGVVITTRGHIFNRSELQWALDPTLPQLEGDDGLRLSIDQRVVDEHGGVMLMVNRIEERISFISLRFPPFRR